MAPVVFSLLAWTRGQSAHSATLQRLQNGKEGLMHQLVVLPFGGTLVGVR